MSAGIRVVKLSGAGNDFVALGPRGAALLGDDVAEWTRKVCRRGLSVGADGVLLVEPLEPGRVRVRFLNPDGSEAFCGNGTRCAARFAQRAGYAGERMTLVTVSGEVDAEMRGADVRLRLPVPEDGGVLELPVGDERLRGRRVTAGVPHFVLHTRNVGAAPLERWGPAVRRHPRVGAAGANLDIVERRADGTLAIRTWERGVEGETLACGSGALAAGFDAWLGGGTGRVPVIPASGVRLVVEFEGAPDLPRAAFLSGDARVIFEAELAPEATTGFAP